MKTYLSLTTLFATVFCQPTMSEVRTEIESELQSTRDETNEKLENDHRLATINAYQQVIEFPSSGEAVQLSKPFSGSIYVMVSKDHLDELAKEELSINKQVLEPIPVGSSDDFNFRYNGQTYFTVQKVSLADVQQITYQSSSKSPILLVLYSK